MYFLNDLSLNDEHKFKPFARPCSPKQFSYLYRLANTKRICFQSLVMGRFGKHPDELSATEACELIDELKSRG